MRLFNRVPPTSREEPALMLSRASTLRLTPRKEGVPSRVDARRVFGGFLRKPGSHRGQEGHREASNELRVLCVLCVSQAEDGDEALEERPDTRFTRLEGKPGPARHQRQDQGGRRAGNLAKTAAFVQHKGRKEHKARKDFSLCPSCPSCSWTVRSRRIEKARNSGRVRTRIPSGNRQKPINSGREPPTS